MKITAEYIFTELSEYENPWLANIFSQIWKASQRALHVPIWPFYQTSTTDRQTPPYWSPFMPAPQPLSWKKILYYAALEAHVSHLFSVLFIGLHACCTHLPALRAIVLLLDLPTPTLDFAEEEKSRKTKSIVENHYLPFLSVGKMLHLSDRHSPLLDLTEVLRAVFVLHYC